MNVARTRTFAFALFAAGVGAVAGCGDDAETPSETMTQPTAGAITAGDALIGTQHSISVAVTNPDGIALTWAVTSDTLTIDASTVLTADDTGATLAWEVTPEAAGTHTVKFEATFDGGVVSAAATFDITAPAPEACIYPGDTGFARNTVFPDLAWTAQWADGTEFEFDLYDFHCDDEAWGDYDSLLVLATADWCPNCPAYIGWIDALSDRLEEEGMLVMFLDLQDAQGGPSYTDIANPAMDRHTPNHSGIRAGDADSTTPNAVLMSDLIEYFPTAFVIRRDDMMLIADQRDTGYYLPLVEIAMDPTADWSAPPAPTITPDFETSCVDGDDEEFEPNNIPDDASTITPGVAIDGGVCDFQGDYYRIDIEGDWALNLEFSVSDGDLDVYVWDEELQRPARGDGPSAIGSATADDNESFEHAGPSLIYISGFRNATAPYTLTVTEL